MGLTGIMTRAGVRSLKKCKKNAQLAAKGLIVMSLIDTHCHLYLEEFDADRSEMMQRAAATGIERFYLPAIDSQTTAAMLQMEVDYPGRCRAMMGLHPCSVKADFEEEMKLVADWLARRSFAGVGEIGLDFYWDNTYKEQQYAAFDWQMDLALQYDLPVVIHSRESTAACIERVRLKQNGRLKGIFHCFSGSYEEALEVIDLGFYLGIGGVLTYKNSGLAGIVARLGLEKLVLETDAPYLSPVPYRGKRNESAYLSHIAIKLAEVLGMGSGVVREATTRNAEKIFGT